MRSESPDRRLIAVSVSLVLAAGAAAQAITVFRVAATADDEAFPAVSGNTVVWQFFNSRYGDWDIRGADVSDPAAPQYFTISDFPGDDTFPIIDGNDVVWQQQYRPDSDRDVYAADLSNPQSVSRYALSVSLDDECLPYVANGVAVWQHRFVDAPDWDVLGARLTGAGDPEPFFVSAVIDVDELFPCISGNLVVWHQRMPEVSRPLVWGADITDANNPRSFHTPIDLGEYEGPSLSDGWLVVREADEVGKVIVDNLFDPFNPEGISSSGRTACPKIHKHLVVWQDRSNGTWDIRGYNLVTRQEFAVTNMRMSDQVNPAVHVDAEQQRALIVWQDNRDGNWDIYAAVVDGPEAAAGTE